MPSRGHRPVAERLRSLSDDSPAVYLQNASGDCGHVDEKADHLRDFGGFDQSADRRLLPESRSSAFAQ